MPKDLPKMPDGLEDLLRGLSKAVLKEKPSNILDFSAKYFEKLLIERDGSLMKNYERFEHYEKSLNKLMAKQKKVSGDSDKKNVKSAVRNRKASPKVVKNVQQNDKSDKVPSPIFGDKVADKESTRKTMEAAVPRGKLSIRTRSSISLNAITEESNSEMREERQLLYRNAVKKIQRAFRRYLKNKKQKSPVQEAGDKLDEEKAARIIQNLFKSKFRKKSPPQPRPRSIKNENLKRVAEGGEDSKSLLEYLQEEEDAKKSSQPTNVEHDSDTGEVLTTRIDDEALISNADSLENIIIKKDMNNSQNNKQNDKEEEAAVKIQSTFRGHQARKDVKQQRAAAIENVAPVAAVIEDPVLYKNNAGEMELAAVKIQKNYRGYKVRKDIQNTKNVVNSGNLVASAGNIISSIENQSGSQSDGSNPEPGAILGEPNEIHGAVTEKPEFLNKEEMLEIAERKEIADAVEDPVSNNTNSDKDGSTVPEVSQNTTEVIEPIIGINEQDRDSGNILETLQQLVENGTHGIKQMVGAVSDQIKHIVGVDDTKQEKGSETTEPIDELKHETDATVTATNLNLQIPAETKIQDAGTLGSNTTELTNKIQLDRISNEKQQVGTFDTKHEDESHSVDLTTHQDKKEEIQNYHDVQPLPTIDLEHETGEAQAEAKSTNVPEDEILIPENKASEVAEPTYEPESLITDGVTLDKNLVLNNLGDVKNGQALKGRYTVEPKLESEPVSIALSPPVQNTPVLNSPDELETGKAVEALHMVEPKIDVQHIVEINTDREAAMVKPNHETESVTTNVPTEPHVNNQILDDPPTLQNQTVTDAHNNEVNENSQSVNSLTILQNEPIVDPPVNVENGQAVETPHPVKPIVETKAINETSGNNQNSNANEQVLKPNIETNQGNREAAVELNPETEPLLVDGTTPRNESVPNSPVTVPNSQNEIIPIQLKHEAESDGGNAPMQSEIRSEASSETLNSKDTQHTSEHDFRSQDSLRDLNDPEMADAALKIQKTFRGYQARKDIHQKQPAKVHIIPEVTVDGASEEMLSDTEDGEEKQKIKENQDILNELDEAAVKIQNSTEDVNSAAESVSPAESKIPENVNESLKMETTTPNMENDNHHDAAIKIQKTYRGHQVRKELKQKKDEIVNAGAALGKDIVENASHAANLQKPDTLPDLNDPEIIEGALNIQKALMAHLSPKHEDYTRIVSDFTPKSIDLEHEVETKSAQQMDLDPNNAETNDSDAIGSTSSTDNNELLKYQDSLINDPEMADAALKIQKSFRGHQARKEQTNIRKKRSLDLQEVRSPVPNEENSHSPKLKDITETDNSLKRDTPLELHDNLIDVTEPVIEKVTSSLEKAHQESLPDLDDPEMADAALKIQKSFRGHQSRKRQEKPENQAITADDLANDTPDTNNHHILSYLKASNLEAATPQLKSENNIENPQQLDTNQVEHQEGLSVLKDEETKQAENDKPLKTAEVIKDPITESDLINKELNCDQKLKTEEQALEKEHNTVNQEELKSETSAKERQESLPDLNDPDMAGAALKIQKSFRGHQARKEIKEKGTTKPREVIEPVNDPKVVEKTLENHNDSVKEEVVADQVEKTPKSSEEQRQESLPDLNDPEMAEAALKIQKSFRGHQVRKEIKSKERTKSGEEVDEPVPETTSLVKSEPILGSDGATCNPDSENSAKERQESLPDLNDPEMADAALKIQKSFRGHKARKEIKANERTKSEKVGEPVNETTSHVKTEPILVSDEDGSNPDILLNVVVPDKVNQVETTEKNSVAEPQESLSGLNGSITESDLENKELNGDKKLTIEEEKLEKEHNTVNQEEIKPITTAKEHHESLPDLNDPEMTGAALKIQKSFRGHQVRKEIKEKRRTKSGELDEPIPETTNLFNAEPIFVSESATDDSKMVQQILKHHDDSIKDQDVARQVEETTKFSAEDRQESLPDLNDPEMEDAALKIQKSFRGHKNRKEIKQGGNSKSKQTVEPAQDSSSLAKIEPVFDKDGPTDGHSSLSSMTESKIGEPSNENSDKSATEHQDALPDLNDPEMADAALKIQKSFRGHQTRKELTSKVTEKTSESLTNNMPTLEYQTNLPELNVPDLPDPNQQQNGRVVIATEPINDDNINQHKAKPIDSLMENEDSLPDLNDPEMAEAALKIQKSFRGHKARKDFKDTKENKAINKILSTASAPPSDEIDNIESSAQLAQPVIPSDDSHILNNITPDILPNRAADIFEDENKLVDSLEPILDQKIEDKIDADSLDNFNIEEKTEVIEEPCQKIVYKSKLSMLIESSQSYTQSTELVDTFAVSKPNDDYFDSLENAQTTSEMDESAQTVIEVPQQYDSSIFGLKIEPEPGQHGAEEDSMSRKTTAEVEVADDKIETKSGLTEDEIAEIKNIDISSFEKDSLEAMYYSLRKNELLMDQMHSLSNVEQISDQAEPPRQFTAKHKFMSMGESDSDDIVFKQLSMDYDDNSDASNQHTARSTTDDDADVEVVRNVLYYNDGKQVLPDEVKREPGDGASVASDNLFDNHSNADEQDAPTKTGGHQFEIFSLDEEIRNLESNVAPYQEDNPLFYAQQKIEKFLHQIHGNMNEMEDDADDENDEEFLENPIESNKSYLSENNITAEYEEEDDVLDELRNDFREPLARKVLSSAVSETDSDYIEQSRINPIKDDFNISTALDNYYLSSDSDSTYNSAATKIQAGARGFLTRRRIQSINRQSISERRSSIGNAAIDQSLDDMIEETEDRKKFKFHEAQSTFREDTITSSGEMEMYGITDIKVEEKKIESPVTDSGNESTTSIDPETQIHLRNNYERFTNESSFDAIDEDKLSDVVDVIRTSNVQNRLRSPMKNKTLSNLNFDEYDRVATRRQTLQRGNAVQGNSTPSDEESSRSHPSGSSTATPNSEEKHDSDGTKKTSYDSPIRRKSTDSASLMTKSSNSLPDLQRSPKRRGFIQRQRTMPVQIETEIIRPLPKHMRKRIKSANSSAQGNHHPSKLFKKKATY